MPSDQPFLHGIETGPDLGPRWRFRGSTPGPEQWGRSTWQNALAQFMVCGAGDGSPVGVVSLYEVSFQDGVGKIAAAKFDLTDLTPRMIVGILIFLRYVFAAWPLRRLYFDVPEFNLEQFGSALREYLEVEGRFKESHFAAGRYWDRYTLTLSREGWEGAERRFGSLIS